MTAHELIALVDELPRVPIAELPTPLHEAPRLAEAIGLRQLYIKRDDLTGLAFGGNKTRKFATSFAQIIAEGADTVITGAASQSNHARQAAAACARLGLQCYLVNRYDARARMGMQGNWLLDNILGAQVRLLSGSVDAVAAKEQLANELRQAGRQPYIIGHEAAMLGAVAYARCFAEIHVDLQHLGRHPDVVVTCSASGTHAGLSLGAHALRAGTRVVGFRPGLADPERNRQSIARLAAEAADRLRLESTLGPEDFDNRQDFVGPNYGIPTPEAMATLHLVARTEGILLDPVYTAKAMTGLRAMVSSGEIQRDQTVVFVHTGGNPALFAYAPDLAAAGDYPVRIISDLSKGIL